MANRKSGKSQRRAAALVRVEMRQTMAGPDGVRVVGHRYDLPKDVAEPLIATGAARVTEEQPNMLELDTADPKYPGPWNEDDWCEGISLTDWELWRDPKACANSDGKRLRALLKTDLKGSLIVLGLPGDPPDGNTRPVRKDTLSRIVEEIDFGTYFPPGEVTLQKPNHEWVHFEVRVYRPDRFAEVAQEPKPVGSTKDRRGRKPAFDHAEVRREAVQFLALAVGLPRAQAELENHILNWLAEDDRHPSPSTVRSFVSKEFGYLWVRPNS